MKNLFLNWHFMRFFRLAIAGFLSYEAYTTKQWFFVVFALFFFFQAVFNLGCNGTNGCAIPKKEN